MLFRSLGGPEKMRASQGFPPRGAAINERGPAAETAGPLLKTSSQSPGFRRGGDGPALARARAFHQVPYIWFSGKRGPRAEGACWRGPFGTPLRLSGVRRKHKSGAGFFGVFANSAPQKLCVCTSRLVYALAKSSGRGYNKRVVQVNCCAEWACTPYRAVGVPFTP